ncbi:MAG: cysteine--tRNA ligase, partial [Gemmobacter sp.]|nr:cysteine--tRNA ligase [Gemmobacter sp.]
KAREAEKTLRKWRDWTKDTAAADAPDPSVVEALGDDLNTHEALSRLHTLFKSLEIGGPGLARFKASANLLGLLGDDMGDWVGSADLSALAARLSGLRETAMATKDFSGVDALKSALVAAGVEVRMSKAGVELVPGPGFDPAKLDGLA